jgi:hypothetical protein
MVKLLPYIFGLLALIFGVFFLAYGIKGGLIDKKILSAHPATYVSGKEAVGRGIFYIVLGVLFLFGFFVIVFSVIKKGG